MSRWTVWSVFLALGCAATPTSPPASSPLSSAPSPARAATSSKEWLTQLDRDHPLVGKIWDVKAQAFIDYSALAPRLAAARFVLLGERHDNPDHHRLQARVLEELASATRRPAVVLEMLEISQQSALDDFVRRPDAKAPGLGTALAWEHTSWPPFAEYQPIIEVAFARQLPIFAGNLAQADAKALVKQGPTALSPDRLQELRLDVAFPAPLEASLVEELRASHCGQLPEKYLAPMALAQHARDSQMAKVLASSGARDGAVLIAGGGHARLDRGVPFYLALEAPGSSLASVGFREVRHADVEPRAYASEEGPFDYVWFTPRGNDDDPCASFHAPSK